MKSKISSLKSIYKPYGFQMNIFISITFIFCFIPQVLFCQPQNAKTFIELTKKFLRNISYLSDTLKGVIVIVPESPKIIEIRYDKGNGEVIQYPINKLTVLPNLFVLQNFDFNTLCFIYQDSSGKNVKDFFSDEKKQEISNLNEFDDQLILLNLPIDTIDIDTFQFNPKPVVVTQIVRDTIICWEERKLLKTFGYSLMPGGARFKANKYWQSLGVAILQLAPIPLSIHYNNQYQKYYDMAEQAAARGDQVALNKYYDKSQNYRLYSGIAIGISIASTLFNIFDVIINVKDIQCKPWSTRDSFGLRISKNFYVVKREK